MYRELPMSQRLDRIGEILAKGVYLYLKKENQVPRNLPKEKGDILIKNRIKDGKKATRT